MTEAWGFISYSFNSLHPPSQSHCSVENGYTRNGGQFRRKYLKLKGRTHLRPWAHTGHHTFLGCLYHTVEAEQMHARYHHSFCTVSQATFPQQLICMSCGLDRHLQERCLFWINGNELWSVLKSFFLCTSCLISHKFWITLNHLPTSKSSLSCRAKWHNEITIPCRICTPKKQSNRFWFGHVAV